MVRSGVVWLFFSHINSQIWRGLGWAGLGTVRFGGVRCGGVRCGWVGSGMVIFSHINQLWCGTVRSGEVWCW